MVPLQTSPALIYFLFSDFFPSELGIESAVTLYDLRSKIASPHRFLRPLLLSQLLCGYSCGFPVLFLSPLSLPSGSTPLLALTCRE